MPFPIAAVLGAASAAGGSLSDFFISKANRKSQEATNERNIQFARERDEATRRWEREQMDYENKINRDWWDMTNAYNNPEEQIKRMRAAGLNPAMMYGSSPVNTASLPDSAHGAASRGDNPNLQPPTYDKLAIGSVFGSALQGMQFEMQKRLTDSQIAENVAKANKTITETPYDSEAFRKKLNDQIDQNISLSNANESNVRAGSNLRAQQAALNVDTHEMNIQSIARMRAETEYTGVKKRLALSSIRSADVQRQLTEWELQQRKKGINPNDPGWYKDAKKVVDDVLDDAVGGDRKGDPEWHWSY